MRRNKKPSSSNYLEARIKQLHEDRDKTTDPIDTQWYNRIIQELQWVREVVNNKYEKDCALKVLF